LPAILPVTNVWTVVDGNKRMGAACMLVFLELNNIEPACSVEELFIRAMEVATGSISHEELASRLRGGL